MNSAAPTLPFIKPCPPAGSGVHRWVYYAYHRLREAGFSHEQAAAYCKADATRELNSGDIPSPESSGGCSPGRSNLAEFSFSILRRIASNCPKFGIEEIKARSPLDPDTQTTESFLRALFLPSERVLLFHVYQSQGSLVWQSSLESHYLAPFKKPYGKKGAWLLINPVTGTFSHIPRLKSALNPYGRSRRCVESLTAYKYLLLESDVADPPEAPQLWLAALAQLPLPIVSITSSGGKSVHALVRIGAGSLDEWRHAAETIAKITVPIGADQAPLRSPAYLSRLPGCFREDKQSWQELIYLNPHADGTPICQMPEKREERP